MNRAEYVVMDSGYASLEKLLPSCPADSNACILHPRYLPAGTSHYQLVIYPLLIIRPIPPTK